MSDILQGLLEHLHSILQKNIQGRGIEASRIVRDVVTHCLDSVTASEIGEIILFHSVMLALQGEVLELEHQD